MDVNINNYYSLFVLWYQMEFEFYFIVTDII